MGNHLGPYFSEVPTTSAHISPASDDASHILGLLTSNA